MENVLIIDNRLPKCPSTKKKFFCGFFCWISHGFHTNVLQLGSCGDGRGAQVRGDPRWRPGVRIFHGSQEIRQLDVIQATVERTRRRPKADYSGKWQIRILLTRIGHLWSLFQFFLPFFGHYFCHFGHFSSHVGTFLDIFGHVGTFLDILGHFGTFWDILGHVLRFSQRFGAAFCPPSFSTGSAGAMGLEAALCPPSFSTGKCTPGESITFRAVLARRLFVFRWQWLAPERRLTRSGRVDVFRWRCPEIQCGSVLGVNSTGSSHVPKR